MDGLYRAEGKERNVTNDGSRNVTILKKLKFERIVFHSIEGHWSFTGNY